MRRNQRVYSHSLRASLVLLGVLVLAPQHLWAQQQQPATCTDWTSIQSWSGTITVSGAGQANDPVNIGTTYTTSVQGTISFAAATNPSGSNLCGPNIGQSWSALNSQATYSVNIHDVENTVCTDSNDFRVPHPQVVNWDVTNGSTNFGNATLQMDFSNPQAPTYTVGFGEVVDGVVFSSPGVAACSLQPFSLTEQTAWGPVPLLSLPAPTTTPLPATVSPLIGSATFQSSDYVFACCLNSGQTWTVSWNFTPALPDVDVVVTIPDYPTWRPTAGKSETNTGALGDFGIPLVIQAKLIQKSTGQPAVGVIPDRWSFSLMKEVSHEPGLAMNWPSVKDRANPSPPDMTFDKLTNNAINPGLTISNQDTLAEVLNPSQTPGPLQADVVLVSFDWGGWATLNVTATVFGTPIKGHLQLPNGQNVTDILLPLRQPGSHIADVWKTAQNVPLSTPDTDDSEPNPAGRPDCIGDGFTLYEEYRGFMENGKHIEGDPHNKDFFIVNEIGADAEPGIFLFTALTGLTVHKDIQENEVETGPTPFTIGGVPQEGRPLINFNTGQGALEVQQHGVLIRSCDVDGGQTLWPSRSKTVADHAQPGITDFICMQERDAPGTLNPDNTHKGVIAPVDALLQYDVGVSHELTHSVGVLHHGDPDTGEGPQEFDLIWPDTPINATHQPLFKLNGEVVRILDEVSEQDVAPVFFQQVKADVLDCLAIIKNPSANPSSVVDWCTTRLSLYLTDPTSIFHLWVGLPHGKHSGNDQCEMRYPFAQVYPSAAPLVGSPVFYTFPAGSEPLGFSICSSPIGTGVNDPNRALPPSHPQPRYFDARSGRGACEKWVCVNDNYPPVADLQ